MLAKLNESDRARLRVYIGAAPGVGKTYQMLEDAHQLRRQGIDVVVGYVEPHGRADTIALVDGLEVVPRRALSYRDVQEFVLVSASVSTPRPPTTDVVVAATNNTTRLRISVPRQRDCCYTIVVLYCAPDRGNQPTRQRGIGARPLRPTGMLDVDLDDVARWLGRDGDATAWR